MILAEEVIDYLNKSVLCWLATVDSEGQPNVSPKEIFAYFRGRLLIANIASPGSVKNIKVNPKVCVSFVDVYGYSFRSVCLKMFDKRKHILAGI